MVRRTQVQAKDRGGQAKCHQHNTRQNPLNPLSACLLFGHPPLLMATVDRQLCQLKCTHTITDEREREGTRFCTQQPGVMTLNWPSRHCATEMTRAAPGASLAWKKRAQRTDSSEGRTPTPGPASAGCSNLIPKTFVRGRSQYCPPSYTREAQHLPRIRARE